MAELADAAHAVAEHGAEGQTVQEYITHHLSYLTYGRASLAFGVYPVEDASRIVR